MAREERNLGPVSEFAIANLSTCRTCPVQTLGITGTKLGRAAGRDHIIACEEGAAPGSMPVRGPA